MKKHLLVSIVFSFCLLANGYAELVDLGESNQSKASEGLTKNAYDYLVNPADFNKMESSTIFFSLDSDGTQFGTEEIGTGLRGGYAWITDELSLFFLLNLFY